MGWQIIAFKYSLKTTIFWNFSHSLQFCSHHFIAPCCYIHWELCYKLANYVANCTIKLRTSCTNSTYIKAMLFTMLLISFGCYVCRPLLVCSRLSHAASNLIEAPFVGWYFSILWSAVCFTLYRTPDFSSHLWQWGYKDISLISYALSYYRVALNFCGF